MSLSLDLISFFIYLSKFFPPKWRVCGNEKQPILADYAHFMNKTVFNFMERQVEGNKRHHSCVWRLHLIEITIPSLKLYIRLFSSSHFDMRVWPHIFTFEYSPLDSNAIWMMWWPLYVSKNRLGFRAALPGCCAAVCSTLLLMVSQCWLQGVWRADTTGYTKTAAVGI